MDKIVGDWLMGNDTGASSEAIVARMEGWIAARQNYPLDPADFGRCVRLLSLVPAYRARLAEMRDVSPKWAVLVDHWPELERLYFIGLSRAWPHKSPELYQRMRELETQADKQ